MTPGSTKIDRPIPINQFQDVWNLMKRDVVSERYINTNGRYSSFWSISYINAMIAHVVGNNME